MEDSVSFSVLGTPIPKGRPKFGKGCVYTPKRTRDYERHIAIEAKIAMQGQTPLSGPLSVTVTAFFLVPKSWPKGRKAYALHGNIHPTSRTTGDIDNLAKAALDGMNGVAFVDDHQVVILQVIKVYSLKPRLEITVVKNSGGMA